MSVIVRVSGSGMCCSVGFSAPAARAAIRATLDAFQESHFVDALSEPLTVSPVSLGAVWGPARLAEMCQMAIAECLSADPGRDPRSTALVLILADPARPGQSKAVARATMAAAEKAAGGAFHPASRVLATDRAGIGEAVVIAQGLLAARTVRRVLVCGVDSFLDPHSLNHHLEAERVRAYGVSEGFIPGEGAGAVLLDVPGPDDPGLHLVGVGLADEAAHIRSDLPRRGLARTRAVRDALAQANLRMSDMHFQAADLSGEPFYAQELALGTTRAFDRKVDVLPLLCLADSLGETGAAAGPLALAYLAGAMPRGHTRGPRAILHFSSDAGRRASIVIEHRAARATPQREPSDGNRSLRQ